MFADQVLVIWLLRNKKTNFQMKRKLSDTPAPCKFCNSVRNFYLLSVCFLLAEKRGCRFPGRSPYMSASSSMFSSSSRMAPQSAQSSSSVSSRETVRAKTQQPNHTVNASGGTLLVGPS